MKDRKGYCAYCKHNPDLPLSVEVNNPGSRCYGCWFTDEKPNWEKETP